MLGKGYNFRYVPGLVCWGMFYGGTKLLHPQITPLGYPLLRPHEGDQLADQDAQRQPGWVKASEHRKPQEKGGVRSVRLMASTSTLSLVLCL